MSDFTSIQQRIRKYHPRQPSASRPYSLALTSTQRNGVNTIKKEGPALVMRSGIYRNYVTMLTEVESNGSREYEQVNSYFKQAKAFN